MAEAGADLVRRVLDANLRYYEGLGRLTVDYARALAGLARDLRPAPPSPQRAAQPVAATSTPLVLEAAAGGEARAVFLVANHLPHAVSAPVVLSPLVDDAGREHGLALRVDPGVVALEAGERALVQVAARVPADLEPGAACRGEITIPGLGERGIPVFVRRLADQDAAKSPRGG